MNLHPDLTHALTTNSITTFTEVQLKTIPLFKKQDIIVQSPTGTGKTLAYIIPIINFIYTKRKNLSANKVHSLIIVPTRELAVQVVEIAELFEVSVELLIGGIDKDDQYTTLSQCYDIIIGTPGRLFQILKYNQKAFDKCEYLVLDEADKLLNFNFRGILESIINFLPKQRRTGLFTATFDESIVKLSKMSLRDYEYVKVDGEIIPDELSIEYVIVSPFRKLSTLLRFMDKKIIVFFSSSAQVDYFYALYLKLVKIKLYKIHGKMENCERLGVYENFFRDGNALFCTDLAARGIDFKNVEYVIHFDCPVDPSNFIHRSGRTARNGETGTSIMFVMENEKSFINYLGLKEIRIIEHERNSTSNVTSLVDFNDFNTIKNNIDEELKKMAVIAFVSYIRSYKEYHLSYLFNLKEINLDSTMALFFLEKVPQMKELQNTIFKRFKRPDKKNKKSKRNRVRVNK